MYFVRQQVIVKSSVYIETSIPSYLTARVSKDVRAEANRATTLEWWESNRKQFDLFISQFVVEECALGDSEAARRRLAAISDLHMLAVTEDSRTLGTALLDAGAVPRRAEIDALHISVATVHGMEYLLTWNFTHIANATMRSKIESVCRHHGYEPPTICTPQELQES